MADDNLAHLSDIQVESNAPAAEPVKPAEAVKPEPIAAAPAAPEVPTVEPVKTEIPAAAAEPVKPAEAAKEAPKEPVIDEKENGRARELMAARLRAETAEAALKKLQPAAKPVGDRPVMPVIENFKVYEEFIAALQAHDKAVDEWNDRRIEAALDTKTAERIAAAEKARAADAERVAVATKEQASRAKHTDYNDQISKIFPVIKNSPLLKDFIAKNPMGTEVAYELAKNPAILEQLRHQNIWEAGEALLGMAARLKNPPAAVKVSATPEPIKPTGSTETLPVKLVELDTDAYFTARKAQELKSLKERYVN